MPNSTVFSTWRRIFVGDDGLRAGWGVLLFIVCWIALYAAFALPVRHLMHLQAGREAPPQIAFGGEVLKLIASLGSTWVLSRVERRSFLDYGLAGPRLLSFYLRGWLIGVAAVALLISILWAAGVWHFDGLDTHGISAVVYGFVWVVVFSMTGVSEELTFRGYILFKLGRAIPFWIAALFASILFAAVHLSNGGENWFGIFSLFLTGLVFCFIVWRTGSLAAAFGLHASWDWAQSYLFGVADSGTRVQGHFLNSHGSGSPLVSGGSVGPEGSILVIPVMLLIALAVHLTAGSRDSRFFAKPLKKGGQA